MKHGAEVWEEGGALDQVVPYLTANRVHHKIRNFEPRLPY
jgi:hypothetical protein